MSTACTCLPGGPRDPACPVRAGHDAMDNLASGLGGIGETFHADLDRFRDGLPEERPAEEGTLAAAMTEFEAAWKNVWAGPARALARWITRWRP